MSKTQKSSILHPSGSLRRLLAAGLIGVFCFSLITLVALRTSGAQQEEERPERPELPEGLAGFVPIRNGAPAFPGAEGAGALSVGGRGGRVIEVTTLNEDGPGSIREAIEAEGPRIVVFKVSGIIEVRNELKITSPYITIAGQTAPAGGITLQGTQQGGGQMLTISTHDVILRYLRIRSGAHGLPGQGQVNIAIDAGARDVIVDHVSLSWSLDENMSIFRNVPDDADPATYPGISNVTVQNSVLGEGLHPHSTGLAIGGEYALEGWKGVSNISVHHNLFVSNDHRNPGLAGIGIQVINNVIYNWGSKASESHNATTVDWINNYFKGGPFPYGDLIVHNDFPAGMPFLKYGPPSIFIQGNVAEPHHPDEANDNWTMYTIHYANTRLPWSFRRFTPLELPGVPVTIESARSAYGSVLSDVGANQRLGCSGEPIDDDDLVDQRLRENVYGGTVPRMHEYVPGPDADPPPPVSHESQVGGYPIFPFAPACYDGDRDGMPDDWEVATNILNPYLDDSADYSLNPVYTNIEVFLNRMFTPGFRQ